jgi:nucleoside-diphosphate-sugar epimerase
MTAWRLPQDAPVGAAANDGVRTIVIAPAIVYGHGRGLAGVIADGPRTDDGILHLPGSGDQHWATVHTADLGRLYALALIHAPASAFYLAASGDNPTVREIGEAASRGTGKVIGTSVAETEARLGPLAAAFLLDQRATGASARARAEPGWQPTEPSLLEQLESGSYATR